MKKYLIFLLLLILVSSLSAQESKRIYTGLRLGGSVGMVYPIDFKYNSYFGEDKVLTYKWRDGGSFDIAPFVSLQITDGFALQTEIMITKFGYEGHKSESQIYDNHFIHEMQLSRRALIFPILLKRTVRQNKFLFQYYSGPHFTANVGKWDYYNYYKSSNSEGVFSENEIKQKLSGDSLFEIPLFGWTTGLNFGLITTKAGVFFIDARAIGDLGVVKQNGEKKLYRAKLSFSLGYEFGFIDRKQL